MTCEKCGATLQVGVFPFCPHGALRSVAIIGDEWPEGGGRWIENMDHTPVWCENKTALKQEMEKRGLRHTDRHRTGDRYLSDWSARMDPQTLANATALVSRGGRASDAGATVETLKTYIGPPRPDGART